MNGEDLARLAGDGVLVDAPAGEVIRATGADRIAFLHRLLTADIAGLAAGHGRRALLLDLKGHVAGDFRVLVGTTEVSLLVAAGQGDELARSLSRFAVMDDFSAAVDRGVAALQIVGPRAFDLLHAAGLIVPGPFAQAPAWQHADLDGSPTVRVVRVAGFGQHGFCLFSTPERIASIETALAGVGVPRWPVETAEAARILAGEPRTGSEITAAHFPMEIGLSDAIDYRKGCYLGQEPIVRIRDRGHVNWRLCGLRFSVPAGGPWPKPGDLLSAPGHPEGTKTGSLTSVASVPGDPGQGAALALIHRGIAPGDAVVIDVSGTTIAAVSGELA